MALETYIGYVIASNDTYAILYVVDENGKEGTKIFDTGLLGVNMNIGDHYKVVFTCDSFTIEHLSMKMDDDALRQIYEIVAD